MQEPKHGWNKLRPYAQGDLGRVWGTLLEEDLRELRDGGMTDPEQLELDLTSIEARIMTWDTDEGPAAIYGVTPMADPKAGLIWALPGTRAHARWRWITRITERALQEVGEGYWYLTNVKDARNTTQIKWLKKIGFTFINREEAENGQAYFTFVRIMK